MSAATPTRSTKLTHTEASSRSELRRSSTTDGRHLTQTTPPTHKHGEKTR